MREDKGNGLMYVNRDAPNQCEDFVDDLMPETAEAARRTVCAYATDVADAIELMMALGLHPAQHQEFAPRVGPGTLNRSTA